MGHVMDPRKAISTTIIILIVCDENSSRDVKSRGTNDKQTVITDVYYKANIAKNTQIEQHRTFKKTNSERLKHMMKFSCKTNTPANWKI